MADPRIFRSGYYVRGEVVGQTTVWYYGEEKIEIPTGAVTEYPHRSLKEILAKVDEVKAVHNG